MPDLPELVGKVPTYTNEQVWVLRGEHEDSVELRIVGERGGVQAKVELSEYGTARLYELIDKAQ